MTAIIESKIKPGYKETEVGVIPNEWEVKELSRITNLLTNGFVGKATDHYTNSEDGVLYIQGYNVDGFKFNFKGIKYVNKEFHLKNKKSILKEGDLLTIQTGDVGLTGYVPKELEGSNCHALIITRYLKDKAYSRFYHQYFNSIIGRYRLSRIETGSTLKHINCGDLKKLKVPIPPIPEQKTIADCLSTWDKGIEALSALIASKKEKKKGLMQQLLTGKKRLDGFTEEWGNSKLVKYITLGNGRDYKHLNKGTIPVYGTGGVIAYVDDYLFDGISVGIGRKGTIDKPVLLQGKFWTIDTLFYIKEFKKANPYFMFNLFQTIPWLSYNQASGLPSLSQKIINDIKVTIPSLEEQTAISELLNTADKEIDQLEKKLETFKTQKKGLMQVLLTGEKRLV